MCGEKRPCEKETKKRRSRGEEEETEIKKRRD